MITSIKIGSGFVFHRALKYREIIMLFHLESLSRIANIPEMHFYD